MEEAFAKLQKEGKNNVDNLIKWMKDAKIIDATKEQEEKVRKFFDGIADPKNVSLDKFKEVVSKIAEEFKKNLDGLTKQLGEHGPKLMTAAMAGASALKDGANALKGGACALKDVFKKKS